MNRRKFGQLLGLAVAACSLPAIAKAEDTAPDIFTVMRERHSVRSYTDKPVTDADVEKLLRYAMMAPSAANEQPWEFVVIRNRELLDQIGKINHYASFAATAPVAILLCLNQQKEKEKGMSIIDMGTCAENLMLAATGMGIGSVFTGIYPHEDRMKGFSSLCKLPDYILPIGLIVLGYPAITKHTPPDRFNPATIHQNTW